MPKAGWSELWKAAALQLLQARSEEKSCCATAHGQLAEEKTATIQVSTVRSSRENLANELQATGLYGKGCVQGP